MRDSDPARLRRVFELPVRAFLGDFEPAVIFDRFDDGSAIHAHLYTCLKRHTNRFDRRRRPRGQRLTPYFVRAAAGSMTSFHARSSVNQALAASWTSAAVIAA